MANPHYQIEKNDGYTVVKLMGNLDFAHAKNFEGEIDGISNHADGRGEKKISMELDWSFLKSRTRTRLR